MIELIILTLLAGVSIYALRKPRPRIEVDMVPFSMHGINVRSRLTPSQWGKIRKLHTELAGDKCEVCGKKGTEQRFKHDLECHEIWLHEGKIQKLIGMQALCPLCHKIKHVGLADKSGYGEDVREHMAEVNGWTLDRVEAHINLKRQQVRSIKLPRGERHQLDLTHLNKPCYSFLNETFTENETGRCRRGLYE
ncbi:hypothetical protein LFL96_25855 [Paraburkholderia sp. D15]|uniref:hypothetical protein n=1 Tax=Paraburkholderia sp. D15 TaxID=2880218 RepID=UPI00247A7734|nr:hypothetical protein [Paraburkholderia sp. D15]WGS54441.1 hypothetical protein LFL96_25855 [Paraburkholderia sp. D15]